MAIVRIEALRGLKARIETAIPALAGKVNAGQAPSGVDQGYPVLTLIPGPWKFEPAIAVDSATIGDPSAGNVVFNVGAHSGPMQLRLEATTVGERMALEQSVMDFFLSEIERPGIVVVPVTSTPDLGNWIAAFELESDQWVDSTAFDRRLESLIMVNAVIPALTLQTAVYEINTLVLGLTGDMDTTFTTDSMVPPAVEVVQINQDGTIESYP